MARTDLLFGIALLVLAAIILGSLFATRDKKPKPDDDGSGDDTDEPAGHMPLLKARKRLMRPFGDSIMPLGARPADAEPEEPEEPQTPKEEPEKPSEPPEEPAKPKPKRRKKPRLIQ